MNWKPSKVYYGWWIVAAFFLIAIYAGGIVFYGFTALFDPIVEDTGWNYTQISLAFSLRGIESGILAPFAGMLTDRLGPRRLIFTGSLIVAASLVLMSYATSLTMFYGAFALMAIGMSGCTITVPMTAIANWFHKKLGTASGIAITGFGFSGLLIPVIVKLIDIYQWRTTMIILAIGTLVVVTPLSLVFRHKPEQYGLLPDGRQGEPMKPENGSTPAPPAELELKPREALKSFVLWQLALAFICHLILVTAVITHVMPYLTSIEVTRSVSSVVAMAIPLVSIGGRLSFGWLADKFEGKRVVIVAFAMMGLSLLFFIYASSVGIWMLVPFVILFGIGYGGNNALRPSLVGEYFGRANFGTVFGIIMGINSLGGLIGPPLAGWVYDTYGSYYSIWLAFIGVAAVGLISILTISKPNRLKKPNL